LPDILRYDGTHDTTLRPNQLFAASLPYPVLVGTNARRMVQRVWSELLTPFGLRTLAPGDRMYQPIYTGDQRARDAAYHQGTVWAWLIGPFISAYLNTYGRNNYTFGIVRQLLAPLLDHMESAGVGHVSEIFEGAAPHRAVGCFAQAWSVAELLRIWADELGKAPLELS